MRTSRSVAPAPLPDQASGISEGEPESGSNHLRVVPRVLLFVPRLVVEVVNAPIRGALYVMDRYALGERTKDVFFNDERTVGVYPVGALTSGFGLTIGARFIHRDLFGDREQFSVRASFGGTFNQQYSTELSSGRRFGRRLKLTAEAEYSIVPKDRFFGIGNGDEVAASGMPVDPYAAPIAIDTRYQETATRVYGGARVRLGGPVSARLTSGVLWRRFGSSSPDDIMPGDDIAEHYLTATIPGFEQGVAYSYNELELRYDTRRPSNIWERSSLPSTGWLFLGYGGVARGFDRGQVRYIRFGGDVQRYIRLAEGPRLLALRLTAEEVRGEDDLIPFVDLPTLGGPQLLRGYAKARFRDRAMAMASVEYQFDLGQSMAGFLFSDLGRVYPTLTEVTTKDLRIGFGGGLQVHGSRSYLGRLTVGSSTDGGLFLNLSFDPINKPQKRLELD
ncbi:MAG: outer membrane protein assembly factor [Myxococcota bacterium]|nr:outer membrane protein assembly factor [Myxococcota bacterium]